MTKHLAALMRIVTSLCNPPERIELSCLSGECYRNAALLLLLGMPLFPATSRLLPALRALLSKKSRLRQVCPGTAEMPRFEGRQKWRPSHGDHTSQPMPHLNFKKSDAPKKLDVLSYVITFYHHMFPMDVPH